MFHEMTQKGVQILIKKEFQNSSGKRQDEFLKLDQSVVSIHLL
jgi:hypothetical protein